MGKRKAAMLAEGAPTVVQPCVSFFPLEVSDADERGRRLQIMERNKITGKAHTRAKDPTAYKVEFEDGADELYVTPPEWGDAAKALNSEGVKMLSGA